jgi:hypothetical protein
MRKFLFVLASISTLAMMNPATAQGYLPPVNPGVVVVPGYSAPGYTAPSYTAPRTTTPGYMWREQRANDDWRNNTWREQRYNDDLRNNNWRTQRANEDWRQREIYERQKTPNNATDRGYVGAKATDRTNNNPAATNNNPAGSKNNPAGSNNNPAGSGYVGER